MAKILEEIKAPISREMKLFEEKFYQSMQSSVPLLDKITQFIIATKGKQMRPILVFLSARMTGEVSEKTFRGASLIELIHTAALVHDDVVDESARRRNFFSINVLWGNKTAVLIGDYLLSKSVILSTENKDFDLLEIVSQTIKDMSEGELLQLEKARKLDITEDVYYQIIRQKTASLISACCQIGAVSNNVENPLIMKMKDFGIYAGMAFQIKDDLFDYFSKNIVGKPVGIDIKEQKMTLPLIYTLNTVAEKDRHWLINSIKKHNTDKKRVKEVIAFVKAHGGIDYTQEKMKEYQAKALAILDRFPDSPYKKALLQIVTYVIERTI